MITEHKMENRNRAMKILGEETTNQYKNYNK